ncbi:hypothetical protein [Longitalea luteola]|uniref:hypothetical protein n=1 Tax=Longitalea luteola TaxID=2812563 RepID=UPI001A96277D|nr:hypothetical protein [Longitalea luteola]
MKTRLPVVEIKGVSYQYDMEGKKLIAVANPKYSIPFSRLKNDKQFAGFFQSAEDIQDLNLRAVHVMIQKHALMDIKPSKEEQAFMQKVLPQPSEQRLEERKLKMKPCM